jgi:SAM-dependent methyltransferase
MKNTASNEGVTEIEKGAELVLGDSANEELLMYLRYHSQRLALDYEWLMAATNSSSKILEIGGFPFFLTSAVLKQGRDLHVVDKLTDEALLYTQSLNTEVVGCDIETERLPFPDNTFDEVLLNEVFEHLRIDPIHTVEEIRRVLRPNGRLWLSTPNLRSLKGIVNFLYKSEAWSVVGEGVYAQYKQLRDSGCMGHVREYTAKEVTDFLGHTGFKTEAVIFRGEYAAPIAKTISTIFPSLRPYFSVIARK